MRHKPFTLLTGRVIGLLTAALLFNSCLGQGTDQIHGMFDLSFPTTAVCESQVRMVSFRNESNEEVVIEGAAISVGTDPLGNFALVSVVAGAAETQSVNGVLNNIPPIPPRATYSFKINYTPQSEESHSAILDIAYSSPQQGIVQVVLSGSSSETSDGCPTIPDPGGSVPFDGEVEITIDKLVLINGANADLPIRSDLSPPDNPYIPPVLPLILDRVNGTLTLPKIDEGDNFILPPPDPLQVPSLATLLHAPTIITSPRDAEGSFDPDTGTLEIRDLFVHLNDQPDGFSADLEITVTTGPVDFSYSGMSPGQIRNGGFVIIGNSIAGTPLQADTGEVVLVGISAFTNGTGQLGGIIDEKVAVLRIEATIVDPTP